MGARRAVPLLALALFACAVTVAAGFVLSLPSSGAQFPLDDAWIHLVYARNLLSGHGLAYNPGQLETGLTSPLWTLLLVPIHTLGSVPDRFVWITRAFGVLLLTTTAWLALRTLLALHVTRAVAIAAAFAIVLDPHGMLGALSGMEVPLTALLLVWLLHALAHHDNAHTIGAMLLLPLARPEALLVVSAAWVLLLPARHRPTQRANLLTLRALPWFGWLMWCGYCFHVSGYPLPSTFYAKASPSVATWLHNATTLPTMWLGLGWFRFGIGFALCVWGIVSAWRLAGAQQGQSRLALRMLALVGPTYVLAVFLSQPLKESSTFYWTRYVLPAVPASLLLTAFGFDQLWKRYQASPSRRLLLLLPITIVAGWALTVPRAIDHYAGSCRNIADLNVAVAYWLRDNTPRDAWIATHDAGAIAYFSERRVLDLAGLNDHRVVHGGLQAELARTQPRYFAVFPSWFPVAERDRRFTRVFTARAEHYVISSAQQDELPVYRFDPR